MDPESFMHARRAGIFRLNSEQYTESQIEPRGPTLTKTAYVISKSFDFNDDFK